MLWLGVQTNLFVLFLPTAAKTAVLDGLGADLPFQGHDTVLHCEFPASGLVNRAAAVILCNLNRDDGAE